MKPIKKAFHEQVAENLIEQIIGYFQEKEDLAKAMEAGRSAFDITPQSHHR